MKARSTVLTANALISAVLVAALLVAVNYLGTEHHVRWDLTATRAHSLSPQTVKILRTLPGPIQAVAFPKGDSADAYRRFLDTYRYYSPNFQFRIVDPDRDPAEARKYKVTSYGQIVLQRGSASYTVDSNSEDALTNGLLHLLQTAKKTVYVLQGEGEIQLDDFTQGGMGTVNQALTGKGFDVKPLFLLKAPRVPSDASAVVVPAPTRDLLPAELDALDQYYRSGGKLLVMVNPRTPPGLRAWLGAEFHVKAPGGLVIDPVSALAGVSPAVPIVTQYPYTDITQNFTLATGFPVSTPLEPDPKATGVTISPLVRSSDASYVKVNLQARDIRFQPGADRKGPSVLAVQVVPAPVPTATPPSPPSSRAGGPSGGAKPPHPAAGGGKETPVPPKGSAVIFGNSAFIENAGLAYPGNLDLFTSTVAWLTQSGNLVSIAPRASPFDAFIVTGPEGRLLLFGGVLGLPLALLVLGGSIYVRRRRL
jgi:gliding motility-associatede transport system auxiliary component